MSIFIKGNVHGDVIEAGGVKNVTMHNYHYPPEQMENDSEEHEVPSELQTNRAHGILDRAVEAGLLGEDWQPKEGIKKWQLALLADGISAELEMKSKWKLFGRLWGMPSESLRSEATRYKNPDEEKKFRKNLQKIIG